jgi:hypothetical protein
MLSFPRIESQITSYQQQNQDTTYLVLKRPEMTKKYYAMDLCEGGGLRWRKIKEKDPSDAILQDQQHTAVEIK